MNVNYDVNDLNFEHSVKHSVVLTVCVAGLTLTLSVQRTILKHHIRPGQKD